MIGKRLFAWTCSLLVISAMIFLVYGEILGDYLSYPACDGCHANLVAEWKTTRHAKAFETLKVQGEGKQQNPGCLECHVVAFDQEGGFIDMELTPELKDVQCESCHGPGRRHAETMNPADIVGKPGETVCRTCHTEGQDQAFDFETKSRDVHGKQETRIGS